LAPDCFDLILFLRAYPQTLSYEARLNENMSCEKVRGTFARPWARLCERCTVPV